MKGKSLLGFALILMVIVNMFQSHLSIARAIGASIVSIPVWGAAGFIIFNIFLAIYNIFKPDDNLSFMRIDTFSISLVIGIVIKICFNLKF